MLIMLNCSNNRINCEQQEEFHFTGGNTEESISHHGKSADCVTSERLFAERLCAIIKSETINLQATLLV